jgi:hypothetical protein
MTRYVEWTGESVNAYIILIAKSEKKGPLERTGYCEGMD